MSDGTCSLRVNHQLLFVSAFCYVNKKLSIVFCGQRLRLLQGLWRAGVRRVGKQSRCDPLVLVLPLPQKIFCDLDVPGRVRNAGGREVDNRLCGYCPHASVKKGTSRLLLMEITIGNSGCSRENHLGGSKFRTPVDHFWSDVSGFCRENMLVEPFVQFKVVSHTPEQGHCTMIVPVDQSGHE